MANVVEVPEGWEKVRLGEIRIFRRVGEL